MCSWQSLTPGTFPQAGQAVERAHKTVRFTHGGSTWPWFYRVKGKYVLGSTEQCSKFYQYLHSSEGTTENVWANCRFGDLRNSHLHLASVCAMVQALSRFTMNHNLCAGCALPVGLSNNTPNTPSERLLLSWEVYMKYQGGGKGVWEIRGWNCVLTLLREKNLFFSY